MPPPKSETDNPWTGLNQQAHSGTLQLSDSAAGEAAALAAAAANAVELVKHHVADVLNPKGFGAAPSSYLLQAKFSKAAGDLDDILGRFLEILNAMGETFLAAGKRYNETDTDSGAEFKRIRDNTPRRGDASQGGNPATPPVGGSHHIPDFLRDHQYFGDKLQKPSDEHINSSGQFSEMDALSQAQGGRDTTPVDVENPWEKDHPFFESFETGIDPVAVVSDALVWDWMAVELDGTFGDLNNRLARFPLEGSWQSPRGEGGINAAITAAATYRSQANALTTSMRALSQNLTYTAGWLSETKKFMPGETRDKGGYVDRESQEDSCLDLWHRRGFQNWYVEGMKYTNAAIPILPAPTVKPAQPPAQPGPPGPPGTASPGTAAPGTAAPGASQQQLAALRAAQQDSDQQRQALARQQKALEEARRTSEEQARKSAAAQQQQQAQQAAQQAMQQAAQQAQQVGQQLAGAAQQAAHQIAQQSALAGLPGLPAGLQDFQDAAKKMSSAAKGATGGPGPGIGKATPPAGQNLERASKLFPRATTDITATATGVRAGLAPGTGMAGAPMGGMPMGGPGAAGGGGQQKEHKRADYLDSTEHLEEAIGEAPVVAKPVVEK